MREAAHQILFGWSNRKKKKKDGGGAWGGWGGGGAGGGGGGGVLNPQTPPPPPLATPLVMTTCNLEYRYQHYGETYLYHLRFHARSINTADGDSLVFGKCVHTYIFYRVKSPESKKPKLCLVSLAKRQRIAAIWAPTSCASRRHLLLICVLRPWRSVWIMMCHKDGSPNIDLSWSAQQHVVCREAAQLSTIRDSMWCNTFICLVT